MNQYIIANFDRREYLRPQTFGENADLGSIVRSNEGVLAALTVLLADGNGRGGGDLRSNHASIGSWAGCRIAIIDDVVTHAALSEPGMEDVPLQAQLLGSGRDVSATVFQAIAEGEGDYWACTKLSDTSRLSRVEQRGLSDRGGVRMLTAEGRRLPLAALEELFAVFGVAAGLTPYGMTRQFQLGLDRMAPAFGLNNPWEVLGATTRTGRNHLRTSRWARVGETAPVDGAVVAVDFALRDRASGDEQTLHIRLGKRGDSADSVYKRLFPDIEFEKKPSLFENVRSAEVARLLAGLDLTPNTSKE